MTRKASDAKRVWQTAAAALAVVGIAIAPVAASRSLAASLPRSANAARTIPFYFGKLGPLNFGYPVGWRLATRSTSARVTHPARSSLFMQFTITPGKAAVSPLAGARGLLRQMSRIPGYTLVGLKRDATIQHGEIGVISTEFRIGRGAARAHRRALFFMDHEGALVRVLLSAPQPQYGRWRALFARMIESISVDEDE
jgi:hypothetical protein